MRKASDTKNWDVVWPTPDETDKMPLPDQSIGCNVGLSLAIGKVKKDRSTVKTKSVQLVLDLLTK